MTYVIAQPCVDVKDKSCIEQCPVDCIYEGGRALYINPDECIECGACEPACPMDAVYYDADLPADLAGAAAAVAEPAGQHGVEAFREALLVVVYELVDPAVHAGGHRAVGGQKHRVRPGADQGQRLEVIAQRQLPLHGLQPDRRRDVRQHMVTGEKESAAIVGVDHVAGGVTQRGDHFQPATAYRDRRGLGQPPIWCFPLPGPRTVGDRLVPFAAYPLGAGPR